MTRISPAAVMRRIEPYLAVKAGPPRRYAAT